MVHSHPAEYADARVELRGEGRPGVAEQLDRLRVQVEQYDQVLGVLTGRLSPVLVPEPPTQEGADALTKRQPCSEVASVIEESADRLAYLTGRLHNLVGRLDV